MKEDNMNQDLDYQELVRLKNEYEKSLEDCDIKDFRDLRYKLKQVKEKLRSISQSGIK